MTMKDLPKHATRVNDKIAYSWFTCGSDCCVYATDCTHDIYHLWVWHWCDGHIDVVRRGEVEDGWFPRWEASGVQLHTLVSDDPLHLEASIYWPECCGEHGFIRGGEWVQA